MSSNLLEVHNFDETLKKTRKGKVAPQLMEFQVNPELAPFLVSSTRSVVWVEHTSKSETVRAAVRKIQGIQVDIVAAVAEAGRDLAWGNVQDLTTEGVLACVEHLNYFGLDELEILVAPDTDTAGVEFPVTPTIASWLPLDTVVVLPIDRGFVGSLGTIGQHKAVAVVHNASRGMAIAHR
jgi:hypothetical protein